MKKEDALHHKIKKYNSRTVLGFNLVRFINFKNLVLRHATPRKIANAFRAVSNALIRPSSVRALPILAQIESNNTCSLQCYTCPTGSGSNPDKTTHMELDTFKNIIDQMKDHLFYIMLFGFGEPLLHKSIFEMISYATANNIGVVISTNLNNLEPDDAEKLIETRLDSLIVSLDGITQEVYAKYRAGGNVEKVLANIRAITSKKKELGLSRPFVQLQYICMEHNYHQVPDVFRLKDELGVDNLYFEEFGPVYEIKKSGEKSGAEVEELRKKLMFCKQLWTTTFITSNGYVRPCCLTFDGEFGNIADQSFSEIWNSKGYRKSREFLSRNKQVLSQPFHSPCFSCQLLAEHKKVAQDFDNFVKSRISE